ncbi:MAG TPA: aldehyde dehydrogenase family protein [Acidobacteriota bacterium]
MAKTQTYHALAGKVTAALSPGTLLIGSEHARAASRKVIEIINPATGERLTTVPRGDAADVDRAVAAARDSFEKGSWRRMDPSRKEQILWKIGGLIEKNRDELAVLESLNNGKTVAEAHRGDLPPSWDVFYYYAGWVRKNYGETIPVDGNFLNYTLHEPVGVAGLIVPWNYPLLLAAWKIAPALACGCSVVLKPSELTPLTALRLGDYCLEAGVPEGVVNIVTGYGPEAGEALARHPDVDKIAFTGSIRTARALLKSSSETNLKRVSLELGGKSPNVIFPDADLDRALVAAYRGIFANKGEVCSAGSRLLLHRDVYDSFLDRLVQHSRNMKVGDPLDPATQMGAQISHVQLDRILNYVRSGLQEGALLLCGGQRDTEGEKARGFFCKPTVFGSVKAGMKIAQEEIFGPVLSVIPFGGIDEAVEICNNSVYGLVSAVWTRDIGVAHNMAQRIKAGTVWINTYNGFDSGSPFGGYKQSGFGRELGRYALDLYTNVKSVWVALD